MCGYKRARGDVWIQTSTRWWWIQTFHVKEHCDDVSSYLSGLPAFLVLVSAIAAIRPLAGCKPGLIRTSLSNQHLLSLPLSHGVLIQIFSVVSLTFTQFWHDSLNSQQIKLTRSSMTLSEYLLCQILNIPRIFYSLALYLIEYRIIPMRFTSKWFSSIPQPLAFICSTEKVSKPDLLKGQWWCLVSTNASYQEFILIHLLPPFRSKQPLI